MKRREFINRVGTVGLGLGIAGYWSGIGRALADEAGRRPVPRRPFKDGFDLSVIGCGAIVLVGQEQAAADREIARTVDRGVNYFDVAPSYGKGEAEEKLGIALQPYRSDSFLACKTQRRGAEEAGEELETSLRRLKTDHFDLYQLHAMTKMEDVNTVFAPGGAMETLVRAREEGKVRYLGFSAHDEAVALALLDRFDFDSVLYPVNYVCWAEGSFGPAVVQKAKEKDCALLGLKALAFTPWASQEQKKESGSRKCWYRPIDDVESARLALRFALSQGAVSAIPPGDERIYRMAVDLAAAGLPPLTERESADLLASAAEMKPLFRA